MSYSEILNDVSVSISISETEEMESLGLSASHLNDVMAEVARHLLALGAKLIYGGDLRLNGFTRLLFELVQRHTRDSILAGSGDSVTNYFAWPVHCRYSIEELEKLQNELLGIARLLYLSRDGRWMNWDLRKTIAPLTPSTSDWIDGLTSMRKLTVASTDAKVVLGGRSSKFLGAMPGVAEESLIALRAKQPTYIVGGFGGCAFDIAREIGLIPYVGKSSKWNSTGMFSSFTSQCLNNGLSFEENSTLARTPHVDEISVLIMKGLSNLRSKGIL